MNPKRMLWIMLAVVVAFTLFNLFSTFQQGPQLDQVSYRAVYVFDWEGYTTMENLAVFTHENQQELENTGAQFNAISMEDKMKDYAQGMKQLSEKMTHPVEVIAYEATAYRKGAFLEIVETGKVQGLTTSRGELWKTGFGDNQLVLQENVQLVFILPDDARIIEVVPEPSKIEGVVLTWSDPGPLPFPVVTYERRD